MIFFLVFVSLYTLLHLFFFIWLIYSWNKIPSYIPKGSPDSTVVVLVPFRNEADVLPHLLHSLKKQDLSAHFWKVLFVNDHSQDGSVEVIQQTLKDSLIKWEIVNLEEGKIGKKQALLTGIQSSDAADIILTTDADCVVPTGWVRIMSSALSMTDYKMVSGPVSLVGQDILGDMQRLELNGLIAYGATTLEYNHATMCNAANLGYRKMAFLEVSGYEGNIHIASGDDEFLLHKINKRYPGKVRFIKNNECIVESKSQPDLGSLWQQRLRWVSKWSAYRNKLISISAVILFFDFVVGILLVVGAFFDPYLLALLLFRFILETFVLRHFTIFYKKRFSIKASLGLSVFYPFYAVIIGIASNFESYSWKGRKYQ